MAVDDDAACTPRQRGPEAGEHVDASYIDAQVTAHTQAFQLLESMVAGADAEPIETQLTQLRASVAGHLDTARQLQDAALE
jgi:predicted outer membrane protein